MEYKLRFELSDFLKYLIESNASSGSRIPPLSKLSKKINISVSSLREQLEVAKEMGFVDVKPHTGIKIRSYSFKPAVLNSVKYAIADDFQRLYALLDIRNNLEISYWYRAVSKLNSEDINYLHELVKIAKQKLSSQPIEIPHFEHREFHLTIFKHLENDFVLGILEAYWDIYELTGLNIYNDKDYLKTVWLYHEQIAESIDKADYSKGYQALVAHMDLLKNRNKNENQVLFE